MNAVLAAAARAALVAVMVLAALAAPLCAMYGPQGLPWTAGWMAGMLAVILGAGLGLHALRPKVCEPDLEPLTARQAEAARRLAAEALADGHLAIERSALRPRNEGGNR